MIQLDMGGLLPQDDGDDKGSSGVDGIKIEDVEAMGIEKYLSEIKSELINGKYKPSPVKRVMIPKPDGSERPLGIPTVKDRIVQMATKIAIEPVFEADFRECSYGFRPKRSAKQALEVVRKACNNKGYYVVDADIEKFFDNVNQGKLMKLVEQRISDRRILKLIKQWLVSGVLYGNVLTISELGTSQGSVISPLLANISLVCSTVQIAVHFYTFQGELPSAENRNDTVAVIIESVPIAAPCTTSERWFWRN